MSQTIRMTVHYIDGTDQTFEWEPDPEMAQVNMVSNLQKSLHEEYILLEMGDKLMILSKHTIKNIEINAAPPKLPPNAIRGARLVE